MRYNVAQLLKEPIGSSRDYLLDESFTGTQRFAEAARGPVNILRTHRGILVRATLRVHSTLACSRCLDSFVRSSELSIEEEFFPTVDLQSGRSLPVPDEAEEASLIDSNHLLDLAGAIEEYFVTDMPMKPLCRQECLGLCQECGTDLNLGHCDCDNSPKDPRWRALADLMKL
jgi:uncharacterized protein